MTIYDLYHGDRFTFKGDDALKLGYIIFDQLDYYVDPTGKLQTVVRGIVKYPDGKGCLWCCAAWQLSTLEVVPVTIF